MKKNIAQYKNLPIEINFHEKKNMKKMKNEKL